MVINDNPPEMGGQTIAVQEHSCVNQVICQLRLALIPEPEALELMNEAIDSLMNMGYFERDGAKLIASGMVPPFAETEV